MDDDGDPYAFPDDSDEEAKGSSEAAAANNSSSSGPSTSLEYRNHGTKLAASMTNGDDDSDADSMERLTSDALAHEVREMKLKQRERDAALEDDEVEDELLDSDEGIAMDDKVKGGLGAPSAPAFDDGGYPEGTLLWAKLQGFSYWPAIVTVDPMDGRTCHPPADPKRPPKVHVHFIGYANQRAWILETSLIPFTSREAYDQRAAESQKAKKKDFYPAGRLRVPFEEAASTAIEVAPLSLRARLERLGFVYVLVPQKVEVRTAAQRKFPSPASPAPQVKQEGEEKKLPLAGRKRGAEQGAPSSSPRKKRARKSQSKKPPAPAAETNIKQEAGEPFAETGHINLTIKKEVEGANSGEEDPQKESSPVVRISTPEQSEEIRDLAGEDDEFRSEPEEEGEDGGGGAIRPSEPKLGGLIWGRMSGFPFWPCFVTKSPEGEYVRRSGKRVLYHAQFFNWNDESGWVGRALPWCTLEEFRQQADRVPKKPASEWKSWHPGVGRGVAFRKKWTAAYEEAQSTAYLSRKERHDRYVVFYRDQKAADSFAERFVEAGSKKRGERKGSSDSSASCGRQQQPAEASSNAARTSTASGRRPAPAKPRKRRLRGPLSKRVALDAVLSPTDLPTGWEMTRTGKARRQFTSPEGVAFPGLREVVGYLFQQNVVVGPSQQARRRRSFSFSSRDTVEEEAEEESDKGWFMKSVDAHRFRLHGVMGVAEASAGSLDGSVRYLSDGALPAKWLVKEEKGSKLVYLTPEEDHTFRSKFDAANYMEPKGHPAVELELLLGRSVRRCAQRRQRLLHRQQRRAAKRRRGGSSETDDGDSSANTTGTSIHLKRVTAAEILHDPVLGKTVIPTFVEMVKLPDVFLDHPCVRVREEAKEMVITDVDTEEFIAKKINYD